MLRVLTLSLCLLATSTHAFGAIIYDAAADFSTVSNPNGAWSYGYMSAGQLGGTFHSYDLSVNSPTLDGWYDSKLTPLGLPVVYHNPSNVSHTFKSQVIGPNQAGFHPGEHGEYSVFRLTINSSGSYLLHTLFYPQDGATTDVHVLLNNVSLYSSTIGNANSYDNSLNLIKGDTIDFAVGYGSNGNYFFDSTGLVAQLSQQTSTVPEPATLMMWGFGIVGGGLLRCRRRNVA